MLRRNAILLLACWSLLASPMLCLAGAIEHACHGPAEAADACADATPACDCDPHGGPCSHDTDCSSDPCSLLVVAKSARSTPDEIAPLDQHARLATRAFGAAPARHRPGRTPWDADVGPRLPVHPSDLPLLN